jgi:nucleoside-diphosphate-sugar epimerase
LKVTVFGAGGFIGRNLVAYLRENGIDCAAPARDYFPDAHDELGHVIYCIGLTGDFRRRPLDTVDAHVCFLHRLLTRTRFESLLYLSSTRVYSGAEQGCEGERLMVDPAAPADLYNISKVMGESLCLHSGRQHVRVVRLSNVYGLDLESENFLSSILSAAVQARALVFQTAPESTKDYVSVADVVRVLPQIATRGACRVYNVASGRNVSNAEIAYVLGRYTGCSTTYAPDAPAVGFPPISIERVRAEFGFTPGNLLSDLPRLIQEYSEHIHGSH